MFKGLSQTAKKDCSDKDGTDLNGQASERLLCEYTADLISPTQTRPDGTTVTKDNNWGTTGLVPIEEISGCARCAFSDRNLHSRMPLDPTHVRLKLLHACDQ
jgi:hypothetical protein